MKRCIFVLLAALICLSSVGCGGARYADDVSALDVANAALDAFDSHEDYMDGTGVYFSYYFEDHPQASLINDRVMLYHRTETNVNEISVFRTASAKDAQMIEDAVEHYIEEEADYLAGFSKNYSPSDMEKIDNADTDVIGCYVIAYVLSPKDEDAALRAVRELLSQDAKQ